MKKKNNYAEMLKSPLWQKKRLEIMQRDNFTCQYCGCNDRELHVHHFVYRKNSKPWEYNDNELITLCNKCHEVESEYNNDLYDYFVALKEAFKQRGISMSLLSSCFDDMMMFCEEIDNDLRPSPVCDFIKNAVYGTQNYKDAVVATKSGANCRDLIEDRFPEMLTIFDEETKK